jgi:hypothetical protein
MAVDDLFSKTFRGGFSGVLQWQQLEDLWLRIQTDNTTRWYIYDLDQLPPTQPASPQELEEFLRNNMALLRREHKHDYCGIVYADNIEQPSMIKVFHPKRLGVVCGISSEPVLPAWILSRAMPVDLVRRSSKK